MRHQPTWLTDLIKEEVHERIWNDSRTIERPGTLLGWPEERIVPEVLKFGQADFDQPVGHLVGADRALLYAHFNLPRHRDELLEAFEQLFSAARTVGTPTLVDLGCGPFTAGLALAATLGGKSPFHYHGFDRATSMLELGQRFADSAARRGAFHGGTQWRFAKDLDSHDFGRIRNDTVIIVASYLLASTTVQVGPLVSSILDAIRRIGPGPVALLYTNSAKDWPNRNFEEFRDALVAGGFRLELDEIERFKQTRNPTEMRYALLYRSAQDVIPLGEGP